MLIQVDPHSGVPIYRQLMDQIKFHIASGLLSEGDELPSIRQLAGQLGINPMTISKSYTLLEKDLVVERRPGRPLVVKAQPEKEQEKNKFDQLRMALRESVIIVRQLGLSQEEALATFKRMLEEERIR